MVYLSIGLAISILGISLLQAFYHLAHIDSLKPLARLGYWLPAIAVLLIAALQRGPWLSFMGIQPITLTAMALAVIAVAAKLATTPLSRWMQAAFHGEPTEQNERLRNISALSSKYKLLIVLTAAVVEEVLYRGYAIGIGQYLLGSLWLSLLVSLVAFIGIHFRWGLSHMIPVFFSGLILSLLFIASHDLLACVVAHFGIIVAGNAFRKRGAESNNSFNRKPLRGSG